MADLVLDPARTALVVIDLQEGVLARTTFPHTAAEVLERSSALCARFREARSHVVLVRVSFSADGADALNPPTDGAPPTGGRPAGWDVLSPALGSDPRDIHITKRQWGAFYGTDLDLQLRRRGVSTIVLCGIATNYGVESTARAAYEHGYAQVFVEDATSGLDEEGHRYAMRAIFPRMGKVRSTAEVLRAVGGGRVAGEG